MDYYETIFNQLTKLDIILVNKQWTPKQCVSKITKAINQLKLPSKIDSNIYFKNEKDMLEFGYEENLYEDNYIVGSYDFEKDENRKPAIEIVYFFTDNHTFLLDNERWLLTKNAVTDIMTHEIIHLDQFRARDFDFDARILVTKEPFDYLSNQDEIQAHAYNAAREIWRKEHSLILKTYLNMFKDYPRVKKEFLTWMYYYMERINDKDI